ncbi:hypothetical protein BH23BAC1_BH23BAC1_21600 [soil metagenome]
MKYPKFALISAIFLFLSAQYSYSINFNSSILEKNNTTFDHSANDLEGDGLETTITPVFEKKELKATYSVVEQNQKKGLADERGTLVIPARYDDLGWTQGVPRVIDNVIGYKENNSWGIINIKNSRVTAPLFLQVLPYGQNLIITSQKIKGKGNSFGVINTKGKSIIPFNYSSITGCEGGFIAGISKDKQIKYGLIDPKNNVIISINYKSIKSLSNQRYAATNGEGKVALYDDRGMQLMGFELDSIGEFKNNRAYIFKNGKQGMIDKEGNVIIPPSYKKIIEEKDGFKVLNFPEWQLLDGKNLPIAKFNYDQIKPEGVNIYKVKVGTTEALINTNENFLTPNFQQISSLNHGLSVFKKEGKCGVVNFKGEVILNPQYDTIYISENNLISQIKSNPEKWAVHDHTGISLTSNNYQKIVYDESNLLPVKRNNSWGFVDFHGREVIPVQYDTVLNFYGQVAKAMYLGTEGVINSKGEWIVNPWNDYTEPVNDGLVLFRKGNKSGLMKPGNKEIYSTENSLIRINSGFIEKTKDNKLGLVNHLGKVILYPEYDEISELQADTIYVFKKENNYGIITKSGKIKVGIKNNFQELHPLMDNYLGVKINNRYGFVDINGNLRVSNQYEGIGHYQENMAPIKLRGNWGYIDKIERLIIQPIYDEAYSFSDGLAIVKKNNKYGLINRAGKVVLSLEYDKIQKTDDKRYLCYQGEKVGLASDQGRLLIFPKYDQIVDSKNNYVIIKRDKKYGLMTLSGVDTIPMVYDMMIYDEYNEVYLGSKSSDWESISLMK